MLQLPPLYGGGYLVALLQVCVVYYGASVAIHWLGPLAFPVKSIQVQPRQPGQVRREAFYSLGEERAPPAFAAPCLVERLANLNDINAHAGPIAVKAAVLTIVERLHAAGVTKLYEGPIMDITQVLPGMCS